MRTKLKLRTTIPMTLAVVLAVAIVAPAFSAAAKPGCYWNNTTKQWVCPGEVEIPSPPGNPGNPGDPGDPPGENGPPTTPNPTRCEYRPYSDVYPGSNPTHPGGDVPPDAEPYIRYCWIDGAPVLGPYLPEWLSPGEVPAPPSPAEVAANLWLRVQTELDPPNPVTSPAEGQPSVLDLPTFVAVEPWQGVVTERACELGVCITITATPTLTFEPGEPGAAAVTCAAGGTRFDPDGASPEEQASAPGACTHTYTQRTGVNGRPAAWPGQVTLTWAVGWVADTGESAVFDSPSSSADVPRVVEEVQSVVNGSGG